MWILDILMEYHGVVGVVGNRHTSGVLLGLSVDLWSICIQRMRPTVELSFVLQTLRKCQDSSGVDFVCLRSCTLHGARSSFDPCLVTFVLFAPRVIHVCLTADWHLDYARDRPILVTSI